ncbi:eclosion hormone [Nesidiocoris tenuis]|uniref:Eclosion hormone n=1 Tax=Nesidiocoris tenuis TaxID=355587 RepID=A0ABN7AL43_9HEMI|nr:eclosion hormone [Nesidiocoris tenuis]
MQGVKYLIAFLVISAVIPERAAANTVGVCIRNCAQCKKMFGAYFQGELCADTCLKFKGKLIPDCEDVTSIGPFLNKLE